jgi:signal transduction histidine kinase
MRLRTIRSRVLVLIMLPLLSLIGLYSFTTSITADDAVTLARALSIRITVDDPTGLYGAQVETERLLATVYLAAPTPQNRAALAAQEAKTDRFLSEVRAAARSASAGKNASPQVKAALAAELTDSAGLPALRRDIGSHTINISQAQNEYSAIVAAGFNTIMQTVLEMPNAHLETQSLAVMRITQGMEILLQEQALLVGDVMTHSFSAADHARFASLVGEHRGLIAEAMSDIDPVYLSYYRHDVSPAATTALTGLENAVINTPAAAVSRVPLLPFELDSGIVAAGLGEAGFRAGLTLATYGNQVARPVNLQLILAGGLGLLAIFLSVIASIWIGRGLVRELGGLRSAALELADVRLPQVVTRLSSGEDVGTDDEVPFPNPSHDEIGQVRQAFNSVQRTAIEAAVGQARLRAGVATIFRNLARRSQTLLHRQLAMLDDLELRAAQPGELESLFQLDHLTTRMRRHAEGLVVLAGDRPGRGWNKPVPLADVLRAAVAEVEDYRRVRVITRSRAALEGRAVADVIHLIAELVENATLFSPPNTPVRVIGDLVGRGFAVEIEDRGLGIAEAAMSELNAKLADPPQVDLSTTEQLGLYVAARLAKEHRIRVTLRDSPFGGTAAVVLIPSDLVVSEESYSADPDAGLENELAIQTTGRHVVRTSVWDLSVPGGDAAVGRPGPVGGHDGSALSATVPPQVGDAGPFIPATPEAGEGLLPLEAPQNGNSPVTEPVQEAGDVQHDPGVAAYPATADLTEFGLPRRTRQASLAPELRDPQPSQPVGTDDAAAGWRSPGETRDAFTALQHGWERGRAERAVSVDSAAVGVSEGAADDYGGTQRPSTSEHGGTP